MTGPASPTEQDTAAALAALRVLTPARIALGRRGSSLPTQAVLDFALAHAQARDAVHDALDVGALRECLHAEGWTTLAVRSRAPDRRTYLLRPDQGRRLDTDGAAQLAAAAPTSVPDLACVLADGLSARAVQLHAAPLLAALRERLHGLSIAPLVVATQARVALADEAGALLGARVAMSLIGERPGLSSADSLGAYLTCAPRVGRTDAERVCVSNIRPGGLDIDTAAATIADLVRSILASGASGVAIRAESRGTLASRAGD